MMENKLNIRLGINKEDFPLLYQVLFNEQNKMRRTRKLCAIAESALQSSRQSEVLMDSFVQNSSPKNLNVPTVLPGPHEENSSGNISFVDSFKFDFN